MARRVWVIGGVAVGVGALALSSESRTWLRRRIGLEPEDRRWFEEENEEHAEHEGDEPLDTRESRYSLRARLAEEGHGEPAAPEPPAPEPPASEPPAPAFPAFESPLAPAFEPSAPEPPAFPAFDSPSPAPPAPPEPPAPSYAPFESVPSLTPEADAPKTPGEDTNEIEPLPAEDAAPADEPPPPPPPTMLRPPPPPRPARPFSGEGASFRSAIDAARERVHGAAREATPDDGEGSEHTDERA